MGKELTNDEIVERVVKASDEERLRWAYVGVKNGVPEFKCSDGKYYFTLTKELDTSSFGSFPGDWLLGIALQDTPLRRHDPGILLIKKPQRELATLGKELEKTIGSKASPLKIIDGSFLA